MTLYVLKQPAQAIQFSGDVEELEAFIKDPEVIPYKAFADGSVHLWFNDDDAGINLEIGDYVVLIGDDYEVCTDKAFNDTFTERV